MLLKLTVKIVCARAITLKYVWVWPSHGPAMFLLLNVLLYLLLFLISVIKMTWSRTFSMSASSLLTHIILSVPCGTQDINDPHIFLFCAICSASPQVSFTELSSAMTVRRQVVFGPPGFLNLPFLNRLYKPFTICLSTT